MTEEFTEATVILFKPSGKYYTEEKWRIPEGAIGPSDMLRSPDFRQITGGAVLVDTQEPWGFPHLIPARVEENPKLVIATVEESRDQAYRERAHFIANLAARYQAFLTIAVDADEPGWYIVFIYPEVKDKLTQMSWHIPARDVELFSHVPLVPSSHPQVQWDGHSTPQKYENLQSLTKELMEKGMTGDDTSPVD